MAITIIEAKDNRQAVGAGIQHALGYAESLNILFVFSNNGEKFLFHGKTATNGFQKCLL